jgi:hypothetical protein
LASNLINRRRSVNSTKANTEVCPFGWFVVLITIAVFVRAPVSAQQATPNVTLDVPPASLCTVEAPSFEELNAIVRSPAYAIPQTARTPGVVPEGMPADETVEAAITRTIRELVGCYNAGELLRSYGLYTGDYLNRLFNRQGGFSRAVYDSYATPEPVSDPSKHTAILEIKDIRTFEDGSAGATVTLRYAGVPVPKTFFMQFVRDGDHWLIADILGEISFSLP